MLTSDCNGGAPTQGASARRLSRGQELLSLGVGVWLVVGLFLDGWAHNHHKPETIFTPWHAVLYSGFLACAALALWVLRQSDPGPARTTLPVGLGLVLVGVAVFGVGAMGDLIWHSIFGIEIGVAALLSPTHLVMLVGGLLVLTGPFRAGWADADLRTPSMGQFLPTLVSLALVSSLVAFFFMYLSPFRRDTYGTTIVDVTRFAPTAHGSGNAAQVAGVAAVLVATALYLGPLLLVLRRWRPPFGTAMVLFSAMTTLVGGLDAFHRWPLLLAGPIAGLGADLLMRELDPSPARPWALRAFATAVPALLWLSFFALYQLAYGLGWAPELWAGVTVKAALVGAGMGLLRAPPAVPSRLNVGPGRRRMHEAA